MDYDDDILRQVIGLGGGESRQGEFTGTKALMMAVLEEGIRDYCRAGRQCSDAEAWVWSDGRGAFSFTVVCETLALEPAAVRLALVRLRESALPPGRIRPMVRKDGPKTKSR